MVRYRVLVKLGGQRRRSHVHDVTAKTSEEALTKAKAYIRSWIRERPAWEGMLTALRVEKYVATKKPKKRKKARKIRKRRAPRRRAVSLFPSLRI